MIILNGKEINVEKYRYAKIGKNVTKNTETFSVEYLIDLNKKIEKKQVLKEDGTPETNSQGDFIYEETEVYTGIYGIPTHPEFPILMDERFIKEIAENVWDNVYASEFFLQQVKNSL